MNLQTFDRLESNVRGYCRSFPTVFSKAQGELMFDEAGTRYIDFFSGAGVLNYGHNPPELQQALVDYLIGNNITHALDMATIAKRTFLETFERVILQPRNMDYKLMFPGPTGTNAVEAALKLARKVTGRHNVVAFTNGFHGMTLGSLALTGNSSKRGGAGVPLHHVSHMPYCNYLGTEADTIAALEQYLNDSSSGMDHPAAFVVETIQAEGGVNVATAQWLKDLEQLAQRYGVLLIIDDIQVGCGRTGTFFSFENYGLSPDLICLSKSLSGYGLPLSLVMLKPEHDQFTPGEHNGTFRGHNPAFVTATKALETYWQDTKLTQQVNCSARLIRDALLDLAEDYDAEVRGRGLIQGIQFADPDVATQVSRAAFEKGLVIETSGPRDEVLKCLPPLTIQESRLKEALEIIADSVHEVLGSALVTEQADR